MNIDGAFCHILTGLAAFVATAIAGVVVITTGFRRADGIASLVMAMIMLRAAYGLLSAFGRVLLEAAPEGVDVEAIRCALTTRAGVTELRDLQRSRSTTTAAPADGAPGQAGGAGVTGRKATSGSVRTTASAAAAEPS